ncbi:MAG: response regulator [Candidatus Fermentibacteria bacterium]|nr:response regulator [Candidatus Fermentibacteria bacterium]
MASPAERLDSLILHLEKSAERPVHDVVSDFEEAVTLSVTIGRADDSLRLIQEYSNYFHNPIPFEVRFFCAFQRSVVAWRSGDLQSAEGLIKKALKIAEDNGSLQSAARSSMTLGALAVIKGRFSEALAFLKKAEDGLRVDGGYLLARCLNWLGQACFALDLFKESWKHYTEALELNEELSLTSDQAYVFSNMGLLCQRIGLYKQAERCFRYSMKIQEESGDNYGFADSLANLGMLLSEEKELYREAAPILERAYKMHHQNKAISKAGLVLVNYALTISRLGDKEKAKHLFDQAEKLVFSRESWVEKLAYCLGRAEFCLESGDVENAEKLITIGRDIESANNSNSDSDGQGFSSIYARILVEKGNYELAYSELQKTMEEDKKLDALKSSAMESVMDALTETAQAKKEIARIEEETRLLEQKNTSLLLSEERFRGLVNSMTNIGVLAVDLQGVVTFWNDTCEKLYGYESSEACGTKLSELIVPEHLHEWITGFIQARKIDNEFDVNLRAKNGKLKSVLVSLVPFRKDETFIIQVDLTRQRDAENQKSLIEAQMRRTQKLEALGTLAGGIAHDFNNLLQGILGNAAMLCKTLNRNSPHLVKAERIQSAAERSADLCTQMLDYAGVKPVSHQPMDINNVVRDISVLMETSLPKDVELVMDLSNRVPQVIGDMSQMRQVIMNLVLNGAESIEGSGQVSISTDFVYRKKEQFRDNLLEESPDDGDFLLLKVRDTGSGIDAETLTRIFDPFYSTKQTGRGLGLAAVLGIIRGHSGVIMVHSKQDIGTEFSVYLHAAEEEELAENVSYPVETNEEHTDKRILVVDDEEIVRETIHAILSSMGFDVVSAPGGAEALAMLKKGEIPDLMMLDLTMPGLNGAEVFRRLRGMEMNFPVLVVSGYSKDKLSSLFPGEGPNGFLQKPFSPEALIQALNEIFSRTRFSGASQ